MNKSFSTSVFAIALGSLVAINAHASGDADAIESVNQQFENAFSRSDAAGIAAVYSRDGQLLPPNNKIVSGASEIVAFWQGAIDMGIKSAELDTVELDQQGDTAIEVGRYVLTGGDGQVADEGKYIVVWKKEDNAWKYHRDMWSSSIPSQ